MSGDYELDILQWGKGKTNYEIMLSNVSEIYEPEQDKGRVEYKNSKFSEIPEWLFSKKVTSRNMSRFIRCDRITSIPENLFKNNVNATNFSGTFYVCRGITSIPENLFKYNVNATNFYGTFEECRELLYIPNTIIEYAKRLKEKGGNVGAMFKYCTKASNYNSLPAYMK